MLALAGFGEQELGAAANDGHAMPDELLQHRPNVESLRAVTDQGQHDDADRGLQRRILVEQIQDDFPVGIPL